MGLRNWGEKENDKVWRGQWSCELVIKKMLRLKFTFIEDDTRCQLDQIDVYVGL